MTAAGFQGCRTPSSIMTHSHDISVVKTDVKDAEPTYFLYAIK